MLGMWAVCLLALSAMIVDLQEKKIPNSLILTGLGGGLLFRILMQGVGGLFAFLGGVLLPTALLGGLFYFRMIGAGDIKLLAVIGGYLGAGGILRLMFCALLFGGVLALVLMLYRKNLCGRLLYFGTYVRTLLGERSWRPYRSKRDAASEMPFTVPIFLSLLCYVGGFL